MWIFTLIQAILLLVVVANGSPANREEMQTPAEDRKWNLFKKDQGPQYEINPNFGFRSYHQIRYEPMTVPLEYPEYATPLPPLEMSYGQTGGSSYGGGAGGGLGGLGGAGGMGGAGGGLGGMGGAGGLGGMGGGLGGLGGGGFDGAYGMDGGFGDDGYGGYESMNNYQAVPYPNSNNNNNNNYNSPIASVSVDYLAPGSQSEFSSRRSSYNQRFLS